METIAIQAFNGGINNVLEPHLLELNYANNLRNCTIHNGAIKSAFGSISIDSQESELLFQTGNRSIVKWGGQYYWSDNDSGELGSTIGYLGLISPRKKGNARGGVAGGRFLSNKTYQYFYTYRTIDGNRSAPYSTSDFIQYKATTDIGSILLSDFDEDNMPAYATAIELWRTVGNGSDFFKLGEAGRYNRTDDGKITYEDKTIDDVLIFNEKYDLTQPDGIQSSGKYLCERNSVFYIASGDRVYFSKQSNPHSYPELNYLTFDDTVTGMLATEDFTMVFTRNRPYYIAGDSIADIRKVEIPDSQGVSNWKTIGKVRNMPIWVSNDGLCAYQPYDNRSGRKITVLTENLFNLPLSSLSACVANDVYYLFYKNETIAFDFLDSLKIYYLDWAFEWAWYDRDNDVLVGKKGETYYDVSGGDQLTFEYTSPEFTANDMQRFKQMGRMHVDANCALTFTYYADGVEKWSYVLPYNGVDQRTEYISPLVMGRRIQVKISGKGTLRGLRFDYIIRRL